MVVSDVLILGGKSWSLWLGGYLFPLWSIYGYFVDYVKKIPWRSPIRWSIAGLYLPLYLATVMFYWWPVELIYRPLWFVFGALFVIGTALNLTSHHSHDASSSSAAI
jgi:hypothetical protein